MYIYIYTWKCVNVNDPSHQLLLILLNSPNVQTHMIIPKWYRNRSENSSLRPEPISCAPAKRGPWQFPAWQRLEFLAFPSKLPEPFGCVSLQEWSGAILGSLLGSHCKCRTSAWYPSSEIMKDFSGYLIWSKLALGWRLNWEFPYPSAMFKAVSYRLSTMISPDLDPSLYGYRWRELKLKATIICSKPPATSQSQIPKLLGCAVLTLSCHHSTLEDQRIDDGLPWKIVGSTQNVLSLEKDIRTSIYHG